MTLADEQQRLVEEAMLADTKAREDALPYEKRLSAILTVALEAAARVADDESQEIAYSGQYNNWIARQDALKICSAAIRALIPPKD